MPSEASNFDQRLEELFHKALDLEPEARSGFLDLQCEGDKRLRASVERLLAASRDAESESFWRGSALQAEANEWSKQTDNAVPERYRLVERIGAGGMGAVYKAVRADDVYSKIVAIKIVPLSDPHLMERFRQERQILAALEHPNIARLLDGGSTADGRPFLAMEFVDGPPIDRFVKDRRLGVRETVSLFRKVCGAVSYAHRNLV
ncbi:MAG TPA: protein kinase, partial [Bryobacteraceae bacterium]